MEDFFSQALTWLVAPPVIARLGIVAVALVFFFQLRASVLARISGRKLPVLDARFGGYDTALVRWYLGALKESGRYIYAWTQVVLDLPFPFVYSGLLLALLAGVVSRMSIPAVLAYIFATVPCIALIFDLAENVATIILAWRYPKLSSRLVSVASVAGSVKMICIAVAVLAPLLVAALLQPGGAR